MNAAELTLDFHYAKDLKDVKTFGTMDPYALVWIEGCGEKSVKVRTPMARKGGQFPRWEYTIKFHIVPMKIDYNLIIDIKHEGKAVDRHIASATIPFKSLLAINDFKGKGSYPLYRPSGNKKGDIIFSHEFSPLVVIGNYSRGITNVTNSGVLTKCDKAQKLGVKVLKFSLIGGFKAGLSMLGLGGYSSGLSALGMAGKVVGMSGLADGGVSSGQGVMDLF